MEVEDAMAQLKEAFPSEPEEKLREALRRNGNSCDSAAESVLLGDEGGASSSLATSSWAGPVRENALREAFPEADAAVVKLALAEFESLEQASEALAAFTGRVVPSRLAPSAPSDGRAAQEKGKGKEKEKEKEKEKARNPVAGSKQSHKGAVAKGAETGGAPAMRKLKGLESRAKSAGDRRSAARLSRRAKEMAAEMANARSEQPGDGDGVVNCADGRQELMCELHGKTAPEAKEMVRMHAASLATFPGCLAMRYRTGIGRHTPGGGGGVLRPSVMEILDELGVSYYDEGGHIVALYGTSCSQA